MAKRRSAGGPSAGSLGGSANWAGTEHERGVAAFLAAHVLAEQPVRIFDLPPKAAVPQTLRLQANEPVDDIVCALSGGGSAYLQVKTHLDYTRSADRSFASVLAQWSRQAEKSVLKPSEDRLLAVAETTSGSVRILRDVLDRARHPVSEADTAKQLAEKKRLEQALVSLTKARRRSVIGSARIVIQEFARDGSPPAALAVSHLRLVVGEEHAEHAWTRLLKVVGAGARLRAGYDREALADELRKVDIDLSTDVPGSSGALRGVEARYRQHLIDGGATLSFVGLGATIPAVDIDIGDADVPVAELDATEDREHPYTSELHWWVRRRGEALLTGLPGSGKSTALRRAAAFYAQTPEWPLPIIVHLDRLAKRLTARSFRDALLDLATEHASLTDREVLRKHLDNVIDSGRVLLAFDALDESRDRRHEVIRLLSAFLGDVSDDAEVVVSTRDVAYADARALEFRELRLLPPADSDNAVRAILRRLADRRDLAEPERPAWVDERVKWVTQAIGSDAALAETPLVATLLAQLAATHSTAGLPTRRASIMWRVVESVVARWERTKDSDAQDIGSLSGPLAQRALLESYPQIATTLMEDTTATASHAREQVTTHLQACFGLRHAEAEVTAEQMVAFWDRAGFFVASGEDEQLSARLQLFAEVGAAKHAVTLDAAPLDEWIAGALEDPDRHETLRLVCELEPSAVDRVVALSRAEHAMLASSCARAAEAVADATRAALVGLLAQGIDEAVVERWSAVKRIIEFARADLPAERDLVRSAFVHLEPKQRVVAEAAAVIAWDEQGAETDAALAAVFDVDRIESSREDALSFLLVDQLLSGTVVAAARRLLPGDRLLAERLAAKANVPMAAMASIRDLLVEFGFRDLIEAQEARERAEYAEAAESFDLQQQLRERHELDIVLLRWLAASAEPSELRFVERRRLDDLVNFWTYLGMGKAPAFEPSGVYHHHAERLERLIELLLTVTGLRGPVLAGQAQLLLTEIGDEWHRDSAGDMLNMPGKNRRPRHWEHVDREAAFKTLVPFLGIGRWLPPLARQALAFRGFEGDDLERLERYALRLKRPWQRGFALELVVALGDTEKVIDEYLASDDPARRAAAGTIVAHKVHERTASEEHVAALVDDADDQVRTEFLTDLAREPISRALLDRLAAADWAPRAWTCFQCAERNPPGGGGCQACNTVGGEARRAAAKLDLTQAES